MDREFAIITFQGISGELLFSVFNDGELRFEEYNGRHAWDSIRQFIIDYQIETNIDRQLTLDQYSARINKITETISSLIIK